MVKLFFCAQLSQIIAKLSLDVVEDNIQLFKGGSYSASNFQIITLDWIEISHYKLGEIKMMGFILYILSLSFCFWKLQIRVDGCLEFWRFFLFYHRLYFIYHEIYISTVLLFHNHWKSSIWEQFIWNFLNYLNVSIFITKI
jgi:hypothetical protein